MIVNMSAELKTLDGEPLIDAGKPVTLKDVSVNALLAQQERETLDAKEKLARYELALKVNKGGDVEVTVEEIAKIKDCVGKVYPTLVVGQVFHLLEGKN
ncbi:MAG: hypothetical protein J7J52_04905 [Deltaproteobacteria bacterium]|nr:hypothetical protein [Deltaproteobacteria bacterium]